MEGFFMFPDGLFLCAEIFMFQFCLILDQELNWTIDKNSPKTTRGQAPGRPKPKGKISSELTPVLKSANSYSFREEISG